jgi:hypothetical protein
MGWLASKERTRGEEGGIYRKAVHQLVIVKILTYLLFRSLMFPLGQINCGRLNAQVCIYLDWIYLKCRRGGKKSWFKVLWNFASRFILLINFKFILSIIIMNFDTKSTAPEGFEPIF